MATTAAVLSHYNFIMRYPPNYTLRSVSQYNVEINENISTKDN